MSITPIPDPRPHARVHTLPDAPVDSENAMLLPFVDPHAVTLTVGDDADEAAVRAALHLLRATCDVAVGRRPSDQLGALTLPRARSVLGAWALAQDGRRPWTVRTLRAQQVDDQSVEVCARLAAATRSIALAVRMEVRRGRWRCVVAEMGSPLHADSQSRRV